MGVLEPLMAGLTILIGLGFLYGFTRPQDGPTQPWRRDGGLTDRAPERSPEDDPIAGTAFASVVEEAGIVARDEGSVDAGFDALRPHLQQTLRGVLIQRDHDPSGVDALLESGEWTDDPTAAAMLSPERPLPDWPMLKRFRAWLVPERVLRAESRRAVQQIADVAGETLPVIPGQRVPQTRRRLEPALAELQQGVDGELQRALDPLDTSPGRVAADEEMIADSPDAVEANESGDAAADIPTTRDPGNTWTQPTLEGQLRASTDATVEDDQS
jgi:hypothetical protein